MSCFYVGAKRVYQLAEYIQSLYTLGFDYFHYSIPEELCKELRSEKLKDIYEQLAELNVNAVNSKYASSEDEKITYRPYKEISQRNINSMYHPCNYSGITEESGYCKSYVSIELWHYELYKALQCFIYQCSEDVNRNNKLLAGLKVLETRLAQFIVENQIEYQILKWS